MELSELLNIPRGVTALVGGGGKTTAMYTLAAELTRRGTVVCTTTTRIWPPEHLPVLRGGGQALREALARHGCVCAGAPAERGKLAAPELTMEELARAADYVLVEADGSKGLPVKAHLPHEPVIPPEARLVVTVAGASAFGRPVRDVVHRWETFCQLTGCGPETPVSPEHLAKLLAAEGFGSVVFLNQVETQTHVRLAEAFARRMATPVCAGALNAGEWYRLT